LPAIFSGTRASAMILLYSVPATSALAGLEMILQLCVTIFGESAAGFGDAKGVGRDAVQESEAGRDRIFVRYR
jgi:hypothetical protein